MQSDIRKQLISLEDGLLSALSQESTALDAFFLSSVDLQATIVNALKQAPLDDETSSLAYSVLSRIETLASRFISAFEKADAMSTSLQSDLQTMVADLTLNEKGMDEDKECVQPKSHSSPPPYLETTYRWLLDNLHDPYPSKEVKTRMAREANSSLKDVDNWFIAVRRRIGWNKLRMECFNNKRTPIVQAATVFFRQPGSSTLLDDTSLPISERDKYTMEFITIKNNAQGLYASKEVDAYDTSSLPGAAKKATQKKRKRSVEAMSSLPDSSSASPRPTLPPLTIAKRRCSRSESENECDLDQSRKRRRSNSNSSSSGISTAHSASPAPSLSEGGSSPSSASGILESPASTMTFPPPFPSKRKRCLSDSGTQGPAKTARIVQHPRLQTVSNPLPPPEFSRDSISEDNSLEWTCDFPPAVTALPFDDSIPVKLDFHQFSTANEEISQLWDNSPSTQFSDFPDCVSVENIESFNSVENLRAPDFSPPTFELGDGSSLFDTSDFTFDLDQDSYSGLTIEAPSLVQQPQIYGASDSIGLALDLPISAHYDWMPLFPASDAYSPSAPDPSPSGKPPQFADFTLPTTSSSNSQDAKRRRLELLRDEMKRLEADIGL